MIDPMEMSDNDLQKLNSSLREVLAYIKYQRDKARMEKLLNEDSKFSCLETNAALVINAMTNAGIAIDPNKEVVNMCEAIPSSTICRIASHILVFSPSKHLSIAFTV